MSEQAVQSPPSTRARTPEAPSSYPGQAGDAPRPRPTAERDAPSPWRRSWAGWKQVFKRTWHEVDNDNVTIIAAGVAFYAFLAIFPAIAAALSLYGLVADPATVQAQLDGLMQVVPGSAAELLSGQISEIVTSSSTGLSFGALFGILAALWSAKKGMGALIRALNIAYEIDDERSWLKRTGLALLLTLGALVLVLVVLVGLVALPHLLGDGSTARSVVAWLRWPVMLFLLLVGINALYREAPAHDDKPAWRWITPGSLMAAVLWTLVTLGFSFYVSRFGSYNETYGSVGAVAVLLLWFWLSAASVIMGAELNSELARQAAHPSRER